MSDEQKPMTVEQVVQGLADLREAFREDSARKDEQWAADRAETEQRHKAEVARVQQNTDESRALYIRSVAASERLSAAMESIARSLVAQPPATPKERRD